MNDAISKNFILNESLDHKNSKSFSKDLFSQKLGQVVLSNFSLHSRKFTGLQKLKFNKLKTIPKNHTNIFSNLDKDEELSDFINKLNKPFPQKNNLWGVDNNKQLERNKAVLNHNYNNNINNNKKEIKKIMNLKQYQENNKKKDKKFEDNILKRNYNSNKYLDTISFGTVNIRKNIIKKENSKEILGYEIKENKKYDLKNNHKRKYKSQEKISITAISNINDKKEEKEEKEDKNSLIFLKSFYEDFIELLYSFNVSTKYISSINNFNQTYFFLFDIQSFPKSQMNIQFLNTFKYSSILIICLVFLTKDEDLYKSTMIKLKEFLELFIWLCINSINYKILESKKIIDFMKNSDINSENKNLSDNLNDIISLLYSDKMNDYKKIRKCLKQLSNNINDDSPEKILSILNDCILFCHNCSYYIEETKYKKNKKKKKLKIKKENKSADNLSINNNIKGPFIKNKMDKKFCLVLDLDETLIHNLNLPFGNYFFVRPGFFDFLEKIHNIYEIIIFTAADKNYAFSIIDKIDNKNYIDYILYKKHIIYEEGNPIKKLDLIGRDLNKVIIVDNLENTAKYNKKNLYHISSWYNNIYDDELVKLKEKLINIANSSKYDDDITMGLNKD